jgi:hypothetical protein
MQMTTLDTLISPKKDRTIKRTSEQLKDENFRRQKITLGKRGNKLSTFGAKVYIQVLRKGKLWIFTSTLDDNTFPICAENIVSNILVNLGDISSNI